MRYGMYDASRGLTLALAAGLAGFALWGAAQVGTNTPGRFWIAMAIVAAGGLVLALANHVGTWTKGLRLRLSPTTFVFAFLPVLVCVSWILMASQPGAGWQEGRIHSWSNTIGILGVVHDVGLWNGVLAFGFGLVLGLSFDGVPAPMIETVPAYGVPADAPAVPPADEPVAAERRATVPPGVASPPVTSADGTTRTREQTPTR
ncbi:MAG: hypothetical protein ACRDKC_01685 [Gaiellaceae bacterium]